MSDALINASPWQFGNNKISRIYFSLLETSSHWWGGGRHFRSLKSISGAPTSKHLRLILPVLWCRSDSSSCVSSPLLLSLIPSGDPSLILSLFKGCFSLGVAFFCFKIGQFTMTLLSLNKTFVNSENARLHIMKEL